VVEHDLALAAGGEVVQVGVHQHEVEEVLGNVLVEDP
jgi:hypothetical protein